jgi:hypothetical protein
MNDESARLVELGDLDKLTRLVERLCRLQAWEDLVDLRDRCRKALERGKQLWPIASHIDYRLALEAPAPWAAATLEGGTGRFALGPLPEVAASSHTWAELAPHLPPSPGAILDLPLVLLPWEPSYALATYHADRLESPSPPRAAPRGPAGVPQGGPSRWRAADDPDAVRALTDLVGAWTAESNGRAEAVAIHGGAVAAVRAIGAPSPRLAQVDPPEAMALMAWAGASGGAHGRRRGAAPGRFAAWWALAALGGLLDDWPVFSHDLEDVLAALCWYVWDAGEPETGWVLRLAVEDHDEGLAWALAAVDQA